MEIKYCHNISQCFDKGNCEPQNPNPKHWCGMNKIEFFCKKTMGKEVPKSKRDMAPNS